MVIQCVCFSPLLPLLYERHSWCLEVMAGHLPERLLLFPLSIKWMPEPSPFPVQAFPHRYLARTCSSAAVRRSSELVPRHPLSTPATSPLPPSRSGARSVVRAVADSLDHPLPCSARTARGASPERTSPSTQHLCRDHPALPPVPEQTQD
ncbi:uncharacterized protein LOC100216897 [Zea mays]|jgi:hypothetical protein|uniref:Uncharacterized protein n=1 Tax=Zea mays TaxID=4577 RepID=B4FKB0_MAIZE|nr:uncharacterized protein LOC100216897 [Zea mays]ACF82553.1 unknown [Zea mays]|eukprot:NP_001136756.1 uncharacterized protein LOC100216897 [Zea mays]